MTEGLRLTFVALALSLGCNRDPNGMLRQKRPGAYDETPVFEDSRVLRTPPPGTIAMEPVAPPGVPPTGTVAGRPLERIPVPLTRELLLRGRHDFQIWCAACHGMLGDGVSVVATKMALKPPPSLIDRALSPGHVDEVIRVGYGLMPSYGSELGPEERWGVVAYLEALRRSQNARIDEVPAEMRKRLEEGR